MAKHNLFDGKNLNFHFKTNILKISFEIYFIKMNLKTTESYVFTCNYSCNIFGVCL